jgi:hypothetical protein
VVIFFFRVLRAKIEMGKADKVEETQPAQTGEEVWSSSPQYNQLAMRVRSRSVGFFRRMPVSPIRPS